MAYGNFLNYPYQPAMLQPQPQSNGIIWVQGEAGAKSYLVAPNTTVQLWDSEAQVIYLKSADASGMPSFKILDYTIRDAQQPSQPAITETEEYVKKKDFIELAEELIELKRQLNEITRSRDKEGEKK
jgi:hypothetical protein